MTKRQIAVLMTLGLAVVCILGIGGYIVVSEERAYRASMPQPSAPVAPRPTMTPSMSQPTEEVYRSGEATKSLGHLPTDFGSEGQVQELLKLMEKNPGKVDYQIDYQTDVDVVLFGCNFEKDVIIRIHQGKDGHGSQEMWQGYIIERLNNAASGGSLNDTPEGKKLGTFEAF